MIVFARNEEINRWLAEHPVILGLLALVLAIVLLAIGIVSLLTGRAPTKRGPDLEGGQAKAMAIVWLVAGGACLLFALFKIVTGLL